MRASRPPCRKPNRSVRPASLSRPSAGRCGCRRSTSGAGSNFKRNRRGFYSLWIFLFLFITSLFAEVIANDKPFLIQYEGGFYFPSMFTYPETTFGGEFETAADYRDPYLQKKIERSRRPDVVAADPVFLLDA